ncbi:restriction endonuclease subunit S [Nodosilinea sp. FACHB-131]|uniref:restriction endonuclease subunit S n=1 Tax=Cyanophyceae TaxID=3028117 RepID=UPI001685FB5A|nr:restriction endonuclease subunit S [Nodosilinea sp. FACHB-131]MBD1877148.1 restriction endonuclease subunit S [Nodosilinea sp. FACHB-131]
MELKPGYKLTEVGVIPEDWRIEKIGKLIDEQAILDHLDGNHGELYPRSHEFKTYGIPYIGANDFVEGLVKFESCKFLAYERAVQFRKGIARDGDVLFAHNATVGPVALLRTNEPFVILSTTATYFRCNPEKLHNLYFKVALQAESFVRQYQSVMAQSTRFQVPITTQRKLELIIPPLPEQTAIATVLSDTDALLESLDRLIAKKRDLKQATMQQLLTGKTRLSGFEGEWEHDELRQLVQIPITDGPHMTPRFLKSGVPFLSVNNLSDNRIDLTDLRYISKADDQLFSKKCKPKKGDVLIGKAASVGKVAIVENEFDFNIWSPIALVRVNYRLDAKFLYYQLQSFDCVRQVVLLTNASSQGNIGMNDIEKINISYPSIQEQVSIATILSDMDAEITTLEQRRDKIRALKQGMMQELLTGKTRLIAPRGVHA